MEDRQAEERTAHLIERDLGGLRVGAIEIVHPDPPEDGEQGFVVAPVEAERVVGRGIRAVDVRREILEVVLVGKEGEVRVEAPIGIVRKIELLAVAELELRHSGDSEALNLGCLRYKTATPKVAGLSSDCSQTRQRQTRGELWCAAKSTAPNILQLAITELVRKTGHFGLYR